MLELKDVVKKYKMGDEEVVALDGISLTFRNSEFVAILGPSGCGKTTMLNILGGLDSYDSGDLVVDGRSTKDFKDADWDAYRNRSVGFVFQNYNLIPHQTVLANVELALKLSGASREVQRARAMEALEKVGLADQAKKLPAQMSGGQMQRVAIARAIVNDPDIILADEPTGALDSRTSVQVMDILATIAQEKLVVMVTHNPELAADYATRTVRLADGHVMADDNPPTPAEIGAEEVPPKPAHTHLPFLTALGLSANNLLTKKGRTLLTAFAGAIGIIGIALILSLSNGMNDYIARIESETMGSYPLELQRQTLDMMGASDRESVEDRLDAMGATQGDDKSRPDGFSSHNVVEKLAQQAGALIKTNDLGAFRAYVESHRGDIDPYITSIVYGYDVDPQVWRVDEKGDAVFCAPRTLFSGTDNEMLAMGTSMTGATNSQWNPMVADPTLRDNQYELRDGRWPEQAGEVALVLDESGQMSDFMLYTLGLMDENHMDEVIKGVEDDKPVDDPVADFTFDEVLGRHYKVFSPSQLYGQTDGTWVDNGQDAAYVKDHLDEAVDVEVVGVLQVKEDGGAQSGVVYTEGLTHALMDKAASTEVVKEQLAHPDVNVLTGEEFKEEDAAFGGSATTAELMGSMMTMGYGTAGADGVRGQWISGPWYGQGAATVQTADGEGGGLTPEQLQALQQLLQSGQKPTLQQLVDLWIVDKDDLLSQAAAQLSPADILSHLSDEQKAQLLSDLLGSMDPATLMAALPEETRRAMAAEALAQMTPEQKEQMVKDALGSMTDDQKQALAASFGMETDPGQLLAQLTPDQRKALMDEAMATVDPSELMAAYLQSLPEDQRDALLAQAMGSMDTEALVQRYLASQDMDALVEQYLAKQDMGALMERYLQGLSPEELAALSGMNELTDDQIKALMARYGTDVPKTYDAVLSALGYATVDDPSTISIYPKDFEAKKKVQDFITAYNDQAPTDAEKVTYNDLVGMMTQSVTDIVDMITLALLAFVAISLVVSSIMIAIITYISVLERTREIGILRALGATKRDVSRIFTAETFIEGLLSGLLGVLVAVLLDIPISYYVEQSHGVAGIAVLPVQDGLILVAIAVGLTLLAGFIPSMMAAKKDPVEALRAE